MAKQRQVPGPVEDSNERLAERGYESEFARLPDAEVEPIPVPGGGPEGSVSGPINRPLVVLAVGAAIAFTTFGFESIWPLAIGLLLIFVGAIWGAIRNRTQGRGSGPVTVGSR